MGNTVQPRNETQIPKMDKNISTSEELNNGIDDAEDQSKHSTSRTTVDDLPPEILIRIFSLSPLRELCLNISPVCKRWYLFSRDRSLWKHLSFTADKGDTEDLCLLLSNATQLQSLQLNNRKDADAVLQQVSLSNRNLQVLIIESCHGSPQEPKIHEEVLLKLIQKCCTLVEISIKETKFYSEAFLKMMCNTLPDLKRIHFNYKEYVDPRSLNWIACNCKPLEEVCILWQMDLKQTFITPYVDGINELCTRMKDSLKVLTTSAMDFPNNVMRSIVQCTCLHTLRIWNALPLTDEGILLLASLRNLTSLEVYINYHVSSNAWHELFIRAKWNSLKELYLTACSGLDDSMLESVGETCPNIQKISLSPSTGFTIEGMSKLLKGGKQLIFLRIDFAHINIFHCFPLIPTYTPNLSYLVYGCMDESVEELELGNARRILYDLKMKLPNLEISTKFIHSKPRIVL